LIISATRWAMLYILKTYCTIVYVKICPATAMQEPRGDEVQLLLILDLGTRGSERSASRPGCALRPGKDPGTHWIGQWVDLRAGLDIEAKGKILCLGWRSNPSRPV
jgi:hypothetical protein